MKVRILILFVSLMVMAAASAATAFAQEVYRTAPADVPRMVIHTETDEASDDYIFLASVFGRFPNYLLIFAPDGELIYYQRTEGNGVDFKPQPTGMLTWQIQNSHVHNIIDSTYTEIDTIPSLGDAESSGHELVITEDGRALRTMYEHGVPYDLSGIGGAADAIMIDCIIHEQDSDGNTTFEFRTSEHLAPDNLVTDPQNLGSTENSPYHCNSVKYTDDGNIIISYRHRSQIVKVNYETGEVMWKLGGLDSDFTFTNDDGFTYQHDAQEHPNNVITLFDNRVNLTPEYSRGVRYQLNFDTMTAERIWEYRHPQDLYTPVIANMQTLPNGNSLISWGVSDMNDTNSNILATEVTPDNEVAFEFGLDVGAASYRVIRASWVGNPAAPPVLDVSVGSDQLTFYMSWNGATEHHTYRIYEGEQGLYENRIAEVERTGFETIATVDLPPRDGDYFYRIEALDAAGTVLGTSRADSVHIGDTTIFLPLVHTQ